VVSSDATQAVCIVDVYGLGPPDDGNDWLKHVGGKARNALIKILLLP
jgi:hypothetical protein